MSMIEMVFLFKQKTAYEMRIRDWSSDVCSSDLEAVARGDFDGAGYAVHGRPSEHVGINTLRNLVVARSGDIERACIVGDCRHRSDAVITVGGNLQVAQPVGADHGIAVERYDVLVGRKFEDLVDRSRKAHVRRIEDHR